MPYSVAPVPARATRTHSKACQTGKTDTRREGLLVRVQGLEPFTCPPTRTQARTHARIFHASSLFSLRHTLSHTSPRTQARTNARIFHASWLFRSRHSHRRAPSDARGGRARRQELCRCAERRTVEKRLMLCMIAGLCVAAVPFAQRFLPNKVPPVALFKFPPPAELGFYIFDHLLTRATDATQRHL
jgi:hypothetical protein